jgi:hypothetical protein
MSPAGFVSGVDEAPVVVAMVVGEPEEPPPPQAPRTGVSAMRPTAIRRGRIMAALRSARKVSAEDARNAWASGGLID